MIIARLIGGLGNQCFQYALGRHLAEIHQTRLLLDLEEFKTYKLHAYSLGHLNIIENIATPQEISALNEVREKHLHFDSQALQIPNETYVRGYWQCELYFRDIRKIILNDLTVRTPLAGKDKEVAAQIEDSASVSIHFRRTDYVTNNYAEHLLKACSLEYYFEAIRRVVERVKNPHFFAFSDDIEWARDNLKIDYPVTFVDHNTPATNYEDLRLMSLCKNNIIANSTFSWWGAWLNNNANKLVIGPQIWFTDQAYSSSKDIVPQSWIKV